MKGETDGAEIADGGSLDRLVAVASEAGLGLWGIKRRNLSSRRIKIESFSYYLICSSQYREEQTKLSVSTL